MPKLGMEPIRRDALVKATIAEIGAVGSLEVTVSRIARRAGMSSALAHHYFGSKEALFLAAMRHVLSVYAAEVRAELVAARGSRARVSAIVRGSFAESSFGREAVGAWLNFYVLAQRAPQARRLLAVYQHRLHSNLVQALRPLAGPKAGEIAEATAALIDGAYIREALRAGPPDGAAAAAMVETHIAATLGDADKRSA